MALLYYRTEKIGKGGAIVPSFVTHGVTHNKKGPTAIAVSPWFKWSGREDLNLRLFYESIGNFLAQELV